MILQGFPFVLQLYEEDDDDGDIIIISSCCSWRSRDPFSSQNLRRRSNYAIIFHAKLDEFFQKQQKKKEKKKPYLQYSLKKIRRASWKRRHNTFTNSRATELLSLVCVAWNDDFANTLERFFDHPPAQGSKHELSVRGTRTLIQATTLWSSSSCFRTFVRSASSSVLSRAPLQQQRFSVVVLRQSSSSPLRWCMLTSGKSEKFHAIPWS